MGTRKETRAIQEEVPGSKFLEGRKNSRFFLLLSPYSLKN